MWTHRHCYSEDIPTSQDIRTAARLELAQSIKFGRTVAIVGSGVSAAYGNLCWDELGRFIILDTLDKAGEYLRENNNRQVEKLVREIGDIAQVSNEPGTDDKIFTTSGDRTDTSLLQLCRHVRSLIHEPYKNGAAGNENELDDMVRRIYSGASVEKFKARLRCISCQAYKRIDKLEAGTDDTHTDGPDFSSYLELEKHLFEKLSNTNESCATELDKTLTYILFQFEKFDRQNGSPAAAHDPYNVIINKAGLSRFVTLNYDQEIERAFEQSGFRKIAAADDSREHVDTYVNGYGSILFSMVPSDDSIGDLLVFSSTTTECSASVYHLHGASSPKTSSRLVLSEEDYQNQYLKGLDRRIVFDEGLRTLFGGNDIFFLGVGMSEEDLLRPLRQYLAERPKFPRQTRTLVALQEFAGGSEAQLKKATLAMKFKYNVHIIGYGSNPECAIPEGESGRNNNPAYRKQAETSCCSLQRSATLCREIGDLYDFSREWWEAWQQRPKPRLARWNSFEQGGSHLTCRYFPVPAPGNATDHLEELRTALAGKISDELKNNEMERERLREKNNKNKDPAREPGKTRRILRFSSPGGHGKGHFVNMLRNDPERGRLFGTGDGEYTYIASFFADSYFSTEFNSTISAFGVFIFDTLRRTVSVNPGTPRDREAGPEALKAYLDNGDPYSPELCDCLFDNPGSRSPGRIGIIQELSRRLGSLMGDDERIFICLSDLDRICNMAGYAYNPLHRSAFRFLSDENKAALFNYDLVVVADEPNAPIRYLSRSKPLFKLTDGKTHKQTHNDLEPWIRFPPPNTLSTVTARGPERDVLEYAKQNVYFNFLLQSILSKDGMDEAGLLDAMYHDMAYVISGESTGVHQLIGILLDIHARTTKPDAFPGTREIQSVLKHLALFSYPVEISVIAECPDVKNDCGDEDSIKRTFTWLHEQRLILCFRETHAGSGERYALHRMVRDFLADKMDYAIYDRDEHSFFDVSIFSEQPRDLPSPRYKDYRSIQRILDALNKSTTNKLRYLEERNTGYDAARDIPRLCRHLHSGTNDLEETKYSLIKQVNMLRASIHLMDTAFSIGVISRMDSHEFNDLYEENTRIPTPFEKYCDTANALLCNAVRVDTALELLSGENVITPDGGHPLDPRQLRVFYPTQIAWLYNEQAITRYMQGRLYECLPLFDLALETLNETNWSPAPGSSGEIIEHAENSSLRRVLLNKSLAQIEFGEIDSAQAVLQQLHQRGEPHNGNDNSITVTLAGAYLGLCSHLRGGYDEARHRYSIALEKLKLLPFRERSKALIYKYLGDLDRTQNMPKSSRRNLELAANLAESVHQRDVYHQIMVSLAKLYLHEKEFSKVIDILNDTEIYARKLGIPKLLVDCWMVRGHINLLEKQTTVAGEYLSHAIATSNRNGMVLHKVAALHMYCEVLKSRNTKESKTFASSIHKAAKARSERIGYPFKVRIEKTG